MTDALLIGGLLLIVASLMFGIRKRKKNTDARPTPDEEIEHRRQVRGLRGDLEQIMVEIEQLAKRMGTQLDAKAMHLEMLMREADQKIETLKRLKEDREPVQTTTPPADPWGTNPMDETQDTASEPNDANEPMARSVYALADTGMDATQIAQKLAEHVGKIELILALREQ